MGKKYRILFVLILFLGMYTWGQPPMALSADYPPSGDFPPDGVDYVFSRGWTTPHYNHPKTSSLTVVNLSDQTITITTDDPKRNGNWRERLILPGDMVQGMVAGTSGPVDRGHGTFKVWFKTGPQNQGKDQFHLDFWYKYREVEKAAYGIPALYVEGNVVTISNEKGGRFNPRGDQPHAKRFYPEYGAHGKSAVLSESRDYAVLLVSSQHEDPNIGENDTKACRRTTCFVDALTLFVIKKNPKKGELGDPDWKSYYYN